VKMFDAGKTRMIGLPYGEKTVTICYAVFIVTDGQTDRIAISISSATKHMIRLLRLIISLLHAYVIVSYSYISVSCSLYLSAVCAS